MNKSSSLKIMKQCDKYWVCFKSTGAFPSTLPVGLTPPIFQHSVQGFPLIHGSPFSQLPFFPVRPQRFGHSSFAPPLNLILALSEHLQYFMHFLFLTGFMSHSQLVSSLREHDLATHNPRSARQKRSHITRCFPIRSYINSGLETNS